MARIILDIAMIVLSAATIAVVVKRWKEDKR